MLEECDAEQAKVEERMLKRERKKVQQARIKMKVGKNQPSMKDMLKVCQGMENGEWVMPGGEQHEHADRLREQ